MQKFDQNQNLTPKNIQNQFIWLKRWQEVEIKVNKIEAVFKICENATQYTEVGSE